MTALAVGETFGDLAVLISTGVIVFVVLCFSLSDMWGPP